MTSIQIDTRQSNSVVSGNWFGDSPCNAVLEIKNERKYWVNFRIISVGSNLKLSPVGGENNLYAANNILGPDASVRYNVSFSAPAQSVTVLLDVTPVSGEGARIMNFVQALLDTSSYVLPANFGTGVNVIIDYYPKLANAFNSMPHLKGAADALFSSSPDLTTLKSELEQAAQAGEFTMLSSTLSEFGQTTLKEVFERAYERPGAIVNAIEIIWRNYSNVFVLLFGQPAGFIVFETE